MLLKDALAEMQNTSITPVDLFKVTAGNGSIPEGLSPLDAICAQKAVRFGEPHFGVYTSLLTLVVKAGSRVGMLNNMSGKRGDTPLMKACANGNAYVVKLLLAKSVRDPHLGFIIPPF